MQNGKGASFQRGFTYLALLLAVVVIGIGLVAASEVWSQSRQREKERELLHIGEQFRQAIALYYERTPGPVKRYPEKLEDLLQDRRYLVKQRYLRRIFADPMTGKPEWGLVPAPGGGIMGVYSLSPGHPVKLANFNDANKKFKDAQSYSQWQFVYEPTQIAVTPPLLGAQSQGKVR